jgi:DNA-binding transcriptional LysR family regulator
VNLGHLRIFDAVAKTGKVGLAAESLLVSQPAVSKQVRELERNIGSRLFDRVAQGMRLTEEGRLLAAYASKIFALEVEAQDALDEFHGLRRGRLCVGASTTIAVYLLPEVFVRFRCEFPQVDLELEIANSDAICDRLEKGAIHLALTEGVIPSGKIEGVVFAVDRLVAIASPGSAVARRRSVTAMSLCKEPFVVRETGSGTKSVVERVLEERGLRVSPVMSLGSTEAIKRAVAGGVGVAIVSELSITLEVAARRLVKLNVPDLSISRPLYRLRIEGHSESPAATAFMKMVGDALRPQRGSRSGRQPKIRRRGTRNRDLR